MDHHFSELDDDDDNESTLAECDKPISILKGVTGQAKNPKVALDAKIDELQTENLILRRQMPRLRDMNGKDVTNEFILLAEKLDQKNYEVEELTAELQRIITYYGEQRDYKVTIEKLHSDIKIMNGDINELNAEVVALRTENAKLAAELQDLPEPIEIDNENAARFDEMVAHFEAKIQERDAIINDFRRNENGEVKSKHSILRRLKEDLSFLDGNWKNNDVLRAEVERLINEQSETISEICDNLAGERSRMSRDSESSSIADGNETVHGAFICMSKFKELIQPLIQHLKKLPKFLKEVEGMNQNSQYHILMEQIESITVDLDATIKDVTGAINGLETLERSTPNIFGQPPTATTSQNAVHLEAEVKTLREKIKDEIGKKQNAIEELNKAKEDVNRLERRTEELADEKMDLQNQLKGLEEDFEKLREQYYADDEEEDAKPAAEDVQKLSDALAEARSSIKRRSKEFAEVQIELDKARKNIAEILNEYRELKKKSSETEQLLRDDINLLMEELENLNKENKSSSQLSNQTHETYSQKYAAERHQLLIRVESLKRDNSDLLTQNQQIQQKYSVVEREVKEFRQYMTALIHKMDKDDPRSIECPSFLSPNTNENLMKRLDSTTAKVVQNFDYAYKKLVEIKNIYDNSDEGENSIASNPEIANGIEKTLDEMITELIKSRNISNEIIREIKKVLINKAKPDLSWLLQKNRELRNFLHLSAKFFEAKKKRIEDGAALPDIIKELGKMNEVYSK